MSQTLVQRPTPVHELSSREIINVDDFVAGNYQDDDVQLISHRSRRTSHEPIVIEDSDDDVVIVAGPSRPVAQTNARFEQHGQIRRPSRRTLFSPSPPPQDNYIPPVPPLPPHARAEPPLRWRIAPEIPGPIRPLEQPLAFEQGLRGQHQLPPIHNVPQEPRAGPGRHDAARHLNIGLGGAIFAFNRQNQLEQPRPAQIEQNGGWRHLLSNFGLGAYRMLFQRAEVNPEPGQRDGEHDHDPDLLEALALDAEERQQEFRFRVVQRRARRALQQHRKEDQGYKATFTHPARPEPGFSNDFTPHESMTVRDEPGPSSGGASDSHTVLVCAACLDPLAMNVVGSEEEIRKRKLFALRCGHILDCKCIDSLMKPPPEPILNEEDPAPSGKGKGKVGALDFPGIGVTEDGDAFPLPSVEGGSELHRKRSKGKEKAAPDGLISVPSILAKRNISAVDITGTLPDSMRSRLRPRLGKSSTVAPTTAEHNFLTEIPLAAPPETSLLDHVTRGSSNAGRRALNRRGRGQGGAGRRGKGKAKGAPPVIEAVYEWSCPIASCGRKHKSVRILGVWQMDAEEGAIPMYV